MSMSRHNPSQLSFGMTDSKDTALQVEWNADTESYIPVT